MSTRPVTVLSVCLLPALLGCATTRIVDGCGCTTGFEWYDPAPHLLVKRSVETGAIVEAKVEMLPDFRKRSCAVHSPGLGKSTFKVVTENGILKEFKQNVEDEGPETIETVSTGFKDFAEQLLASERAIQKAKEEAAKRAADEAGTVPEDYGKVAISYEVHRMVVCGGRVVELVQVSVDEVCRMLQLAGMPSACCAVPSKPARCPPE